MMGFSGCLYVRVCMYFACGYRMKVWGQENVQPGGEGKMMIAMMLLDFVDKVLNRLKMERKDKQNVSDMQVDTTCVRFSPT